MTGLGPIGVIGVLVLVLLILLLTGELWTVIDVLIEAYHSFCAPFDGILFC